MTDTLNIYRVGAYSAVIEQQLNSLKALVKQACGSKRRIDRVTQLALLGACDCVGDLKLPVETGIYMSSIYCSLLNSTEILTEIYQREESPSPLKFINTVGNVANFYVAEHFNVQANSMFVSQPDFALQACMHLAVLDLSLHRTKAALLGVVSEVADPLTVHRQRFGLASDKPLLEGSYWLLMAEVLADQQPLANVVGQKQSDSYSSLLEFLAEILPEDKSKCLLACGPKVESKIEQEIACNFDLQLLINERDTGPFFPYTAATTIHDFLLSPTSPGSTLVYIDTDCDSRWNALLLARSLI